MTGPTPWTSRRRHRTRPRRPGTPHRTPGGRAARARPDRPGTGGDPTTPPGPGAPAGASSPCPQARRTGPGTAPEADPTATDAPRARPAATSSRSEHDDEHPTDPCPARRGDAGRLRHLHLRLPLPLGVEPGADVGCHLHRRRGGGHGIAARPAAEGAHRARRRHPGAGGVRCAGRAARPDPLQRTAGSGQLRVAVAPRPDERVRPRPDGRRGAALGRRLDRRARRPGDGHARRRAGPRHPARRPGAARPRVRDRRAGTARPAARSGREAGVKAVAVLVLAVMGVVGVSSLADLTQNRPDAVVDGSSTVLTYDVGTREYNGTDLEAAQALWAVCAAPVSGRTTGPTVLANGQYTVSITPAIGTNGHKRLTGCLQDGTLDRVQGHVRSVTTD